jgi:hypothetical protein
MIPKSGIYYIFHGERRFISKKLRNFGCDFEMQKEQYNNVNG